MSLDTAIQTQHHMTPHLVCALFHRCFVDVNRPLDDIGTDTTTHTSTSQPIYRAVHPSCALSRTLHTQYHADVTSAITHALTHTQHTPLLLDIHGQSDPQHTHHIIVGTCHGATCDLDAMWCETGFLYLLQQQLAHDVRDVTLWPPYPTQQKHQHTKYQGMRNRSMCFRRCVNMCIHQCHACLLCKFMSSPCACSCSCHA